MEYTVDKKGDTTITLRQIKISNIKKWEKITKDDLTESKMAVKLSKKRAASLLELSNS